MNRVPQPSVIQAKCFGTHAIAGPNLQQLSPLHNPDIEHFRSLQQTINQSFAFVGLAASQKRTSLERPRCPKGQSHLRRPASHLRVATGPTTHTTANLRRYNRKSTTDGSTASEVIVAELRGEAPRNPFFSVEEVGSAASIDCIQPISISTVNRLLNFLESDIDGPWFPRVDCVWRLKIHRLRYGGVEGLRAG